MISELIPNVSEDGEGGLELHKDDLWLTVQELSIHIVWKNNGVKVTAYPLNDEANDKAVLDTMFVPFSYEHKYAED